MLGCTAHGAHPQRAGRTLGVSSLGSSFRFFSARDKTNEQVELFFSLRERERGCDALLIYDNGEFLAARGRGYVFMNLRRG